ncbi:MAG: HIT domain-containing protein [Candidatus Cloacimonetes bacterium]|nr:HIT domain-containing protein [Candidatus Cloacimonadota bacterium]
MSEILYSPWRINYILSKKEDGCIFCLKPQAEEDEKHLILHRSDHSFVIMNLYPYNNGHLMIVPNKHVSNLSDLSEEELTDMMKLVQLCEKVMRKAYSPDGFNVGMNLGKAAGAGIDAHLHMHIVPRWHGDSNFMSVISGTRVIPESFEKAYNILKEQFDNAQNNK